MVKSTVVSTTPSIHADRHRHGGEDPLTGDVRIDDIDDVVPVGGIILWHGTLANIPAGWVLCDGTSSTPDLRDKFVRGASAAANPGATGGADTHTLSVAEMPSHTHGVPRATANGNTKFKFSGDNTSGSNVATTSAGSGDAHNNIPAYYAIAYIMKT